MSRWTTLAGVLALSALGIAGAGRVAGATAGSDGDGGFRGARHHGLGRMLEDVRLLDLSDEQQSSLRDLMKQSHETARPLFERQRELRVQLWQAASAPGAEPAKVGQIAIESSQVRQQLKAQGQQMKSSFQALLTPEQKDMWTKIRASREKAREEHRAGRGFGRRSARPADDAQPEDGNR
jgi:Spy/CpxP family protein refolding chaperone